MLANARKFTKVNAILVDTDNFDDIISEVTDGKVYVDYDEFETNMLLLQDEVMADIDEVLNSLSKYFNVEITGYELVKDGESEPLVHIYYTSNADKYLNELVGYVAELKEHDSTEEWNDFWKEVIGMSDEDMKFYDLVREDI